MGVSDSMSSHSQGALLLLETAFSHYTICGLSRAAVGKEASCQGNRGWTLLLDKAQESSSDQS